MCAEAYSSGRVETRAGPAVAAAVCVCVGVSVAARALIYERNIQDADAARRTMFRPDKRKRNGEACARTMARRPRIRREQLDPGERASRVCSRRKYLLQ